MILLTLIHQRSLAAAMYRKLATIAAGDGAHPILSHTPPSLIPKRLMGRGGETLSEPVWASEWTFSFPGHEENLADSEGRDSAKVLMSLCGRNTFTILSYVEIYLPINNRTIILYYNILSYFLTSFSSILYILLINTLQLNMFVSILL